MGSSTGSRPGSAGRAGHALRLELPTGSRREEIEHAPRLADRLTLEAVAFGFEGALEALLVVLGEDVLARRQQPLDLAVFLGHELHDEVATEAREEASDAV